MTSIATNRRIIVATSAANLSGATRAPQLVAVLHWRSPERWNTIVVKSRFAAGQLLRPETLLARAAQASPLRRPVDFIPMKPETDVALLGHVELTGAEGQPIEATATLLVGGRPTELVLGASAPGRVPLAPPHLRWLQTADGSSAVAPRETHDGAEHGFEHEPDFAYEGYQCAHRWLLRSKVAESTEVSLRLQGRALLELAVPPLSPRVMIDPTQIGSVTPIEMDLDTVIIDADRSELELTWRGMIPALNDESDVERVIVGWSSDADMDDPLKGWDALLRELPHGWFEHAWLFADAESGHAPPALEGDALLQARLQSWSHPHPPAPRLQLERFATIQAELAESREPRADTLTRHQIDEYRFGLEERAWLDRIAGDVRTGGGELPIATQYAAAVVLASDRQAAPGEDRRSLRSYAELLVAMEHRDASKVLQDAKVSLGAWIRWDRQITQRQAREPEVARELRELTDELRGRAGADGAAAPGGGGS